ncbi:MAG: ferrous iron transport protein B, partial [Spirochaetota bacterium]
MKITQQYTLAIAGQPNCGKTTLFNLLTGSNQYVGNWPGVTVERKEGVSRTGFGMYKIIDLPGSYGLTSYSLEEKVACDFLVGKKYDLILNIVDAVHLQRHLFLTIQLLLLNRPLLLVLNMMDEVEESGKSIDCTRLSELLNIPVLPFVATSGRGIDQLWRKIREKTENDIALSPYGSERKFPHGFYDTVQQGAQVLQTLQFPEFIALRFFEKDSEVEALLKENHPEKYKEILEIRTAVENRGGIESEKAVSNWIYGMAKGIEQEVVRIKTDSLSFKAKVFQRVDRLALSPVTGPPLFLFILFITFQLTFVLGDLAISLLEQGFTLLKTAAGRISVPALSSFITEGVLGGVGNVLLLIPYVFTIFVILSILEDFGYMARSAFVMDRFMHLLGLHGKSFISLVIGFGCNVPAIMAARTLESRTERIKTILMVPFMSC